jgi:hypothetical protein
VATAVAPKASNAVAMWRSAKVPGLRLDVMRAPDEWLDAMLEIKGKISNSRSDQCIDRSASGLP